MQVRIFFSDDKTSVRVEVESGVYSQVEMVQLDTNSAIEDMHKINLAIVRLTEKVLKNRMWSDISHLSKVTGKSVYPWGNSPETYIDEQFDLSQSVIGCSLCEDNENHHGSSSIRRPLKFYIMHLNDVHKMPREEIAKHIKERGLDVPIKENNDED